MMSFLSEIKLCPQTHKPKIEFGGSSQKMWPKVSKAAIALYFFFKFHFIRSAYFYRRARS